MLPRFGYLKALAVADAVTTLADYGREARLMAGGTDLLVGMTDGLAAPRYVVDIKHIPELRTISIGKDGSLRLGACVTVNEILEFGGLPAGMEALRQAAAVLGTNQVRNRATVGGNLCNASPACDLAPPLLVLGASVRVVSPEGERTVALPDLFKCPKQTCLTDQEILVEIVVPPARGAVSGFAKRQRIRGHDLAVVNAAVALAGDGKVRIAVGAVAPTPLVIDLPGGQASPAARRAEAVLKKVMDSISPIDDVRGSGAYRRSMVAQLVTDLLGVRA
ncbi:MAG: xanthine dehydrogenase family protein subunit M [bacterium]